MNTYCEKRQLVLCVKTVATVHNHTMEYYTAIKKIEIRMFLWYGTMAANVITMSVKEGSS